LFVLFVLHSSVVFSFGSGSEVMNGHGIEKKVNNIEKVKIIQVAEKNPTVVKCSVQPPLSLSSTIPWKASILQEESWCEAYSEKQKNSVY
jgi:hypothetical protein